MWLYALTIFTSALLLFQVQPMIGKYILPWFGSTPAVWTACMLFFQALLLVGYGYAHVIFSRLHPRAQGAVHLVLLAGALALLPITPSASWKTVSGGDPTWHILALLAVSVGGPYLMLASTGPLLQGWFSRAYPGVTPYRLYALSNAGSLLALLSYPLTLELFLRLDEQTWFWSFGFGLFALLSAACAWRLWKSPEEATAVVVDAVSQSSTVRTGSADDGPEESATPLDSPSPGVRGRDIAAWLALSAGGSVVLLAMTNQICQDVAVVPFLWVVPLALYLLTFVICFDSPRWYLPLPTAAAVILLPAGGVIALALNHEPGVVELVVALSTLVFACCMICHGELVRRKPDPRHLTLFYLVVAAGGVTGGLLVAVVAPRVLDGYWESHAGLLGCSLLALAVVRRELAGWWNPPRPAWQRVPVTLAAAMATSGVCTAAAGIAWAIQEEHKRTVAMGRNFYGVLRVTEGAIDDPQEYDRTLIHGTITHGLQYQSPERRRWPTTYYGRRSAIGLALEHHPRRGEAADPFRVGVVGLGTGTIAAYAAAGETYRFYEINPMVVRYAQQYFTYLADAEDRGARLDVLLGDARVVMERQLANGEPQQFDVLAVDAFSSDAIPIHLLTAESFDLYWRHLRPDGILAMHVSNRYLNLTPVVRKLAERAGKTAWWIVSLEDESLGTNTANWVLVTGNETFLQLPPVKAAGTSWTPENPPPLLWTDDFSNLLQVLKP